jgi:hypothetical protein
MPDMKTVKKKVRSFLLLELLIGLALLVLVLVPLIQIPSRSLESEFTALQRITLNQFSERTCAEIKEKIYAHAIPLPLKEKKYTQEDTVYLPVKEFAKRPFSRKCTVTASQKKSKEGVNYFLVKLRILFTSKSKQEELKKIVFTHTLFVEQKDSVHLFGDDHIAPNRQ